MAAVAGFILYSDLDKSTKIPIVFERILGVEVGFLILGNITPGDTVIPEEYNSTT